MLKMMFRIVLIAFCFYSVSDARSGKSTRYWDCCKPSCAWNGKADFRRGPANSCLVDGWSIDRRGDMGKNGCEVGADGSFMCASNQPWSIDDNLAYGFAAAKIGGQSEWDWCCACYRLRFTSGPVNGKQMIVQVTNTGGDLGDAHFDIQIPGGGVGIFNGCSVQYGAPPDGWGKRYGGISNWWECYQLPGDIQPGCWWRFNWFQNADNPTFDFERVKCPTELTDKSNCVRNDENNFG